MKKSLNLMSLQSRRQECLRARIRQWTRILGVAVILIGAVFVRQYLSYRAAIHTQLALESEYEPIADLKKANKYLAEQITAIQAEEQFVLSLSDRQPTVTLLGILSKAVADSKNRVFLKKIELNNIPFEAVSEGAASMVLEMAGIANGGPAVSELLSSLQASLPFAKVGITSSRDFRMKQQSMQDFLLECSF